jgi:uncharacterized protein YlaI
MGCAAKCKICQAKLNTDTAYKVVTYDKNNKPKNAYYCSEAEYTADKEEKDRVKREHDAVYEIINGMFGYKVENSSLFAEWLRWNNLATDVQIAEYLIENREYLCGVLCKDFKSEYAQIKYFSAILCNSLKDFVRGKAKTIQPKYIPEIKEEHYETKYKSKGRQALLDFEEDDDDE